MTALPARDSPSYLLELFFSRQGDVCSRLQADGVTTDTVWIIWCGDSWFDTDRKCFRHESAATEERYKRSVKAIIVQPFRWARNRRMESLLD
jgi:hypothetical protein